MQQDCCQTGQAPIRKNYIGPFCEAAGITTDNFTSIDGPSLPRLDALKSGLVLELQRYMVKKLSFSRTRLVDVLIQITHSSVDPRCAQVYVKRLVDREKNLKKAMKAAKTNDKLNLLSEEIFRMERKRALKDPDTPRKKKLRQQLSEQKAESKKAVKRLQGEIKMMETEQALLHKQLAEEEVETSASQRESLDLRSSLDKLTQDYHISLEKVAEANANFDSAQNDLQTYKKLYEKTQVQLEKVEQKLLRSQEKSQEFSVRNVNRQKKRNKEMDKTISSVQEELKDTQSKLHESQQRVEELTQQLQLSKKNRDAIRKQRNYLKMKNSALRTNATSNDEMDDLEGWVESLQRWNRELEGRLALLDDEAITTMNEGQYCQEVRETVTALLSMNVSMDKINDVIRVVLQKMAGKMVEKLPSKGTMSRLLSEARRLADPEVAETVRESRPEEDA